MEKINVDHIFKDIKDDELMKEFKSRYWDFIRVFLRSYCSHFLSDTFIMKANYYLASIRNLHSFFQNKEFQFSYSVIQGLKLLQSKTNDFSYQDDMFYDFDNNPNLKKLAENMIECIPEFVYHIQVFFIIDTFLNPKSYSDHFIILTRLFVSLSDKTEKRGGKVNNNITFKQLFSGFKSIHLKKDSKYEEEKFYPDFILKKLSCKEPKPCEEGHYLKDEFIKIRKHHLFEARETLIHFCIEMERFLKKSDIKYINDFVGDILNEIFKDFYSKESTINQDETVIDYHKINFKDLDSIEKIINN